VLENVAFGIEGRGRLFEALSLLGQGVDLLPDQELSPLPSLRFGQRGESPRLELGRSPIRLSRSRRFCLDRACQSGEDSCRGVFDDAGTFFHSRFRERQGRLGRWCWR
jgi:hypothetical protein